MGPDLNPPPPLTPSLCHENPEIRVSTLPEKTLKKSATKGLEGLGIRGGLGRGVQKTNMPQNHHGVTLHADQFGLYVVGWKVLFFFRRLWRQQFAICLGVASTFKAPFG